MRKHIFFAAALALTAVCLPTSASQPDEHPSVEERVRDALSRMTTHEKIQLLHAQSKFTSAGVPRLGIRQLNMDDGPHGVREELEWNSWNPAHWTNDSIVAFPSLTCLAATWNAPLALSYGNAVSEEFAFRGKDVILGPGVNIQRTPMNGRAFEYMGEDPFLAGEMAARYIAAAQRNGVACCLKHFALNDQETDRNTVNVTVSDEALREIYLRPFQKAVEQGGVWAIMGSYNKWNNQWCCHNSRLLQDILKGEWAWDGALVSDWGGAMVTDEAIRNGLDIEMGTWAQRYEDYHLGDAFERQIESGAVDMRVLDEKAERVLRLIFRTAMNPRKVVGAQCSEEHFEVCRDIAREGIVMLKNSKSILPIQGGRYGKILVVGDNATRPLTRGGGSSELKTLREVSPLEGIRNLYGDKVDYAQGYTPDGTNAGSLFAEAVEKAAQADLVIFAGGMNKNPGQDCEGGDRQSFDLSYGQNELIAALAKAQPNTVVVTFGGNPYAMPWLGQVAALLHCWYLGSEAGNALADVLGGEVSPSGKLPVTFARRYEDYPYVQYGPEAYPGVDRQVNYREGLFVGYRHFTTRKVKPLFPFGFGLSYTTFGIERPTLVKDPGADGAVRIQTVVRNTGKMAGCEVVQVYVERPQTGQPRPVRELKGFAKVGPLEPGQAAVADIIIPRSELQRYDAAAGKWVLDSGTYTFHVGTDSETMIGSVKVGSIN